MYLISVVVGRAQPLVWGLLFRDERKALDALTSLRAVGDIDVSDDHGQRLVARGGDIGPIMFENMLESKAAGIERTLHEQRIRAAVVSRMHSDPAFKTVAAAGPAVLSPMGMNGMGRG